MSSIKRLARQTLIYGMGAILPRAMNFLFIASYLTFTLDRENYGIHGILYSFVALAMAVFTLRMETAYFRFATKEAHDKMNIFNTTLTIIFLSSFILLTIFVLFRNSLANFLTRPQDGRFIVYFGFILFLDAIAALPFANLRLEEKAVKFFVVKILNASIHILMVLFCFEILPRFFPSYYSNALLLDYAFVPNIVASALVLLLLAKEFSNYKFVIDKKLGRKMLGYAWPLIIVGMAGAINQFADRFMVSYLVENNTVEQNFDQAGLFTGSLKIAVIMLLFTTAFNYAAEPFFFKNESVNDKKLVYGKIALAYTIVACFIFLIILSNLQILQYIIGKNFREGLFILPVALMAYLLLGLYYNFSIWYKLSSKTIYGALFAILGSLITLLFSFILIPRIGIIGASWASLACFSSMCILAYLVGQVQDVICYPIHKILGYILFAIGLYLLMEFFEDLVPKYKLLLRNIVCLFYILIAYMVDFKNLIIKKN